MDGHVDLIAHLDPGQIHERSIENDALRISDLRNGLRHDVILCFTSRRTSNAAPAHSPLPRGVTVHVARPARSIPLFCR